MFRFQSFGSGSSGNSYLIQTEDCCIMIDAGVGIRKLQKAYREYGHNFANVKAILVTHRHVDHARCLGILNAKHGIHAYMTDITMQGIADNPAITKKPERANTTFVASEQTFTIGGLEITPFDVPHDSQGNLGYFIKHGDTRFCLVTDCGTYTPLIDKYVSQATHLVIESNYDPQMLAAGPYPIYLQNRIKGGFGHLANHMAAQVIGQHKAHLRHVWLCHLSEKNNTPQLALQSAQGAILADQLPIVALNRTAPSRLFKVEPEYDLFGQLLD